MKYHFTKKELEDIIRKYGSLRKTAEGTGISRDTIKRHCVAKDVDIQHLLMLKKQQHKEVRDYRAFTDQELIDQLQQRDYFVTKEPKKQDYSFKGSLEPFEGETYKIGICGDTHIGSRYQQLSHLCRPSHFQ